MISCPLSTKDQMLFKDAYILIRKCHKAKCSFLYRDDHNTDYLPDGCTLLVAGLLASNKKAGVDPVEVRDD